MGQATQNTEFQFTLQMVSLIKYNFVITLIVVAADVVAIVVVVVVIIVASKRQRHSSAPTDSSIESRSKQIESIETTAKQQHQQKNVNTRPTPTKTTTTRTTTFIRDANQH